ncbi:polysaccharide deacetylase family protein [Streptomyces sp. 5-8]|uniref:Polysaccharide deacetylase family protein n=1 Tax=Streptomyces musisoli TaxID=2802280 RepID=A0ABS1NT86_9ACTN|nr:MULTISPECIES: polysaccharide deacetylase family protein [Streptomyces]MBL1103309.1 polysaccharide deacetylase family protein [Streptomyces musisoli]MBY8845724.1 polysaccharide deacetylase family protein [Streptomyces sp. SP2-10]
MSMRYAGIAWTDTGYRVEVLDGAGRRVVEPSSWAADRVAELIGWLRELGREQPLAAVFDSTNGLLDGPMTAAGLEVYRADPWLLPPRPRFGSVPAHRLAEQARSTPDALARVTAEGGTLTGRADEYFDGVRRSEPIQAALTAAGRCFEHGRRDTPQVALTFDDGPDPVHTRRILEILDRYGVRATFFCVGHHVAALPDEVRRIAAAGHELGNHSWSHPFLPDLTPDQLREQLDRTTEAVARVTGEAPALFRPPYGALTPEVLAALDGHPTTMTLWDVDSRDWARPGPERIAATVLEGAGPGSVVLMHEGAGDRGQTVQALPSIIEGLLERGLAPVTVGELPVRSAQAEADPRPAAAPR